MENQIENVEIQKETSKEYSARYYKDNRQKHLDYCNTKILCPHCNSTYSRVRQCSHMRSKKHINNEALAKANEQIQRLEQMNKLLCYTLD